MPQIDQSPDVVPVILCGGSGSRLWPLSRDGMPKQFLVLSGTTTLFQQAAARLTGLHPVKELLVVTNETHRFLVSAQLSELGSMAHAKLLLEPQGRNTAPAITLAALAALEQHHDPVLVVVPADQLVSDTQAWHDALRLAIHEAASDAMVVLGVPPDSAHTGYGYIERAQTARPEDVFTVTRFTEKPDLETAKRLVQSGQHLWNAGVFVVKARVWMAAIEKHEPAVAKAVQQSWRHRTTDGPFVRPSAEAFGAAPSISADHAVIERCPQSDISTKVVLLRSPWSDLGAWEAVWETGQQDDNGNVTQGDTIVLEARDCLIHSSARLVGAVGVEDLIIVETPDAVLVAHKDQAQQVKQIVATLAGSGRVETQLHRKVHRPWGWYDNIDEGSNFKVKRIMISPGASISLQQHQHRAEHWIVVRGSAQVTCDDRTTTLGPNESTYIAKGAIHRLSNPGPETLEIIEVQSGDYLGEDDIIRFEDQYGRTTNKD